MKKEFEWSAGTIVGTDHRKPFVWKNNQDAVTICSSDDYLIAVVADGCGSGSYNELGARMGVHFTARALSQIDWKDTANVSIALQMARTSITASLAVFMNSCMIESRSRFVNDHLLFTLLALIVTPEMTFIVGIGDGVYAVNGEVKQIGPYPGNEPPYIAYSGLVKSSLAADACEFVIHTRISTAEVQSACIGTDGAGDFEKISGLPMPVQVSQKTLELVGPLSQFWEGQQFFKNPEAIRRRLNLINNSVSRPNWEARETTVENGRLKDDTTLVVIRRRPQPKD